MALDEIASELYALPPEEFTAARNAKAKEAKQAGDKELASAITALAKPTMVGWLANRLVREYPAEMNSLLELGASLREATASLAGDQLKDLSRQQRQVVYALVQQARGLAKTAGHPASEATARGLEETLHAALADPDVAAQLAAGRMTGVLSRSGFPGSSTPAAPAPSSARRPAAPDTEGALEQAEQAEEAARSAADEAAAERDRVQEALDEASVALTDAEALVEDLKVQLSEAGEAHVQAQRRARSAKEAAERADRLARRTAQKLAEAEERTRRLRK